MKKFMPVAVATIIILLSSCSSKMNAHKNNISKDNSGKPMLLGTVSRSALEKKPFNEWFDKNYADYKVNDSIANLVNPLLQNKTIVLFMGTWCGDSRREIPRMYKILDAAGIKSSQVKLVMVDNHDSTYKQSPQHEERGLNIHRVPDLLVYDEDKELGRIVESPVVSLERDLLSILRQENYVPNYRAVIYMDSLFKKRHINEEDLAGLTTVVKPLLKNSAELNTYGYVLMAAKEMQKAYMIFRLNAMMYPKVANVFDSMGEYYFNTGDFEKAKECYRKVLELSRDNENAKKMLEKMGG